MKNYSLRKSKKIYSQVVERERKKRGKLSHNDQKKIEQILFELEKALSQKNKDDASRHAVEAELFYEQHYKKSFFEWIGEVGVALTVALIAATIIRSMWFELYEIPTGSMRPTYNELDRLAVTKTQFGINIPLVTDHLYFNPDLVQRTGVTIFTSDGLPMTDTDTTYFWLFPAKKRFVKRLMAKPGDTLYFYGGKIYGNDQEGKPILELLNAPWLDGIEHIPFLRFEGFEANYRENGIEISQFHIPIGRIELTELGDAIGKVWDGKQWVIDTPDGKPHDTIQTYSDLFGIKNYAMTHLVQDGEKMFLELEHSPTMHGAKIVGRNLVIPTERSQIEVDQDHLEKILENLYTSRFVVKNGIATSWGYPPSSFNPALPGIEDGTYEFDKGVGYWVDFSGWRHPLKKDHPLYRKNPLQILKLYNFGIEFLTKISPHRYAYFRDGDLYLMGAPIFKKEDKTLKDFVINEEKKAVPFKDFGPPKDASFIQTFGVSIPEKHYMLLGDNHSVSQDSRVFGFVPQENLEGRPSFNMWPPSPRWGFIQKSPYSLFVGPRLAIWLTALVGFLGWLFWRSRKS
jgi:signal peptidase I